MIRRILPVPLLSLALAAMWLVLNRSYGPGDWALAALLAALKPLLHPALRPAPARLRHPLTAPRVCLGGGRDVIVWNFRILRGTLARGDRVPRGGFITVPLEMRDPNGLAVLAAIMCVIPGTVWSELALDRSAVLVHIFDLQDEQTEIDLIKQRYERPLMEIFE